MKPNTCMFIKRTGWNFSNTKHGPCNIDRRHVSVHVCLFQSHIVCISTPKQPPFHTSSTAFRRHTVEGIDIWHTVVRIINISLKYIRINDTFYYIKSRGSHETRPRDYKCEIFISRYWNDYKCTRYTRINVF